MLDLGDIDRKTASQVPKPCTQMKRITNFCITLNRLSQLQNKIPFYSPNHMLNRLTTSQERLIKATLTAKSYPLTLPVFAKTLLSFRKESDVAPRQGKVRFSLLLLFFELF
jgi:hypothetical protein